MPKEHHYHVYILASLSGTLYVGITNDLRKRVWQHKHHTFAGFTADYDVDRLLYWERYQSVQRALAREKQVKGWSRRKKVALFAKSNPAWKDLSRDWFRDGDDLRIVEPMRFRRE